LRPYWNSSILRCTQIYYDRYIIKKYCVNFNDCITKRNNLVMFLIIEKFWKNRVHFKNLAAILKFMRSARHTVWFWQVYHEEILCKVLWMNHQKKWSFDVPDYNFFWIDALLRTWQPFWNSWNRRGMQFYFDRYIIKNIV
jgi:hypothetical protein